MPNCNISYAMLVCILVVLVSTVDADILPYVTQCEHSQEYVNNRSQCDDAFEGPTPVGVVDFIVDSNIYNYCRNKADVLKWAECAKWRLIYRNKADVLKWAECANSVEINCYKPEHQDLARSNSGVRSAIEYFCEREAKGYIFNANCLNNADTTELQMCLSQQYELTTSSGKITYGGLKYNICRRQQIIIDCYRNDHTFNSVCPGTPVMYATVLKKLLPPACDAGNNGNGIYNTGIWSVIVITYLISLFNY